MASILILWIFFNRRQPREWYSTNYREAYTILKSVRRSVTIRFRLHRHFFRSPTIFRAASATLKARGRVLIRVFYTANQHFITLVSSWGRRGSEIDSLKKASSHPRRQDQRDQWLTTLIHLCVIHNAKKVWFEKKIKKLWREFEIVSTTISGCKNIQCVVIGVRRYLGCEGITQFPHLEDCQCISYCSCTALYIEWTNCQKEAPSFILFSYDRKLLQVKKLPNWHSPAS